MASKSSFEVIRVIRDKILNHFGTDHIPAVIVGNKTDLEIQRQVTAEQGKALAKELNCAFVETSARHNQNVSKAFELLMLEIEKANALANAPKAEPSKCIIS